MLVQVSAGQEGGGKYYFIKRKLIKDEALIYNGSIFPAPDHHAAHLLHHSHLKHHTASTNAEHTLTLNPHHESHQEQPSERRLSLDGDASDPFPKIYTTSESKFSRYSNAKSAGKQEQAAPKQKPSGNHISDPLYLRLEKTMARRLNVNFNRYKKGWAESSLRRKGKSVIDSSLQKAAATIQHINNDSTQRRTNTKFTQMLRNNNDERKFSHPPRIRTDIEPVRGRGGRVSPSVQQRHIVEEVYRFDRSR